MLFKKENIFGFAKIHINFYISVLLQNKYCNLQEYFQNRKTIIAIEIYNIMLFSAKLENTDPLSTRLNILLFDN